MTKELESTNLEQPPSNSLGYMAPPLDGTSEVYNNLISIPDYEIVAIDKKYVANKHMKFSIEDSSDFREINILESDGFIEYSCKKEGTLLSIYDMNHNVVISTRVQSDFKKLEIIKNTENSSSDDISITYATIETKSKVIDNERNYKITILNKTTNEMEELNMDYEKLYNDKYYSIYCNNGTDKKTMIGVIKKKNPLGRNDETVTVEVAPMVDYMLLLGLGVLVKRIESRKRNLKDEKTDLLITTALMCIIS